MLSRTCADISRICKRARDFEKAIGQRRFAVVDVRNDGEVADVGLFHRRFSPSGVCAVRQRAGAAARSAARRRILTIMTHA